MAIIEKNGVDGKVCSNCGIWKPLSEYYNNAGHPETQGRKHCTCIECTKIKRQSK